MSNVEIITIGDELLIGQVIDTNSAWIARSLNDIGAQVSRVVTIPDQADAIEQAISQATARASIVITTGGLGPTKDDITKRSIAHLMDVPLERHTPTYLHVERLTTRLGLPFNELNQAQALVPHGCQVLPNDIGTAPGMMFDTAGGGILVALPGVPFEMKKIITDHLIPLIKTRFELRSVVHRTMMTFGLAESEMARQIAPWEDSLPGDLHLAYLPNPRGLRLRLSAYDVQHDAALREIDSRFNTLRSIIGPYMLGYEPASVESSLASLLVTLGRSVAVAESCTGGVISARLTALEGASAYYLGGVTSYSNAAKTAILGVNEHDIATHGAVSQTVAEQMADGARRRFGADYAIATTGIAGPTGGSEAKPVGTVCMAIAYDGGTQSRVMHFGELRQQNIERAAAHAIDMLRRHILEDRNL